MYRLIAAAGFLLAFAGAAHWVVPMGREALALVMARDDAALIADLHLDKALDAPRVKLEMEQALAANDAELAASFLILADARAIPVEPALRATIVRETDETRKAIRGAGRFGRGFVTGEGDDLAGLAGATVGDLTLWGDVRDLGREAVHWAQGKPVDQFVVDIATAGIAVTGVTYAAFGASLPVRAGLSVLKGARRSGVVGARLAGNVMDALRTGRRGKVVTLVSDLGVAGNRAGTRATLAGLRHVDDAADAARLRRLSEVKGGQTLAIFKTLGRGALFITEGIAKLAFWVIAAAFNVFGLVASFNSMIVAMVRPMWRRKRSGSPNQRSATRFSNRAFRRSSAAARSSTGPLSAPSMIVNRIEPSFAS